MKRDDAIRKINAMKRMTKENGASEAEAMSALNAMNKLLDKFNLTLSEVDVDKTNCKWLEFPIKTKKKHPVIHCAGAIAELTGTKCVLSESPDKSKSIQYFGMEQDIIVAIYMVEIIYNAMESEYKTFFKQYKKTVEYKNRKIMHINAVKDSFQTGMAYRLVMRINELRRERESVKATGTGLVALKNQVVDEEFARAFEKPLKKLDTKPTIKNSTALQAGMEAGNKVPLSQGVTAEQ